MSDKIGENYYREENEQLKAQLAEAVACIEHAICLGYLGEGSTKGMCQDFLTKLKSGGGHE